MQSKTKKVSGPKMSNTCRPENMSLEEWQLGLRRQQSQKESFSISPVDERFCPGEYRVSNYQTRNQYKVVYRGRDSIWNYCSCMDFKTSGLGSCKHIQAVAGWISQNRKKIHIFEPTYTSVYVDYKDGRKIKIRIGADNKEQFVNLAYQYFDKQNVLKNFIDFDEFLLSARKINSNFRCYDDALDIVIEKRSKIQRERLLREKYDDRALDSLLSVPLFPYQKEGVRFAIDAGKAIIADEMGLGKTVQAIAAAEIYLREGLAGSVLIVCPTSLKYQWKSEIERFAGREVLIVEGTPDKRAPLYYADAPYKIVSYHTAANDVKYLKKLTTDVLIMDEIQRLKNWSTQIARAARKIESQFSVLLSGTPLENKLEELYASMELVDQYCLGPYYLFRHDHILLNPRTGAVAGYKNLNSIGEQISSRLIRRTKKAVMLQLPKRSDQNILVPMMTKQIDLHSEFRQDLTIILNKYEKFHFLSEADRRRMMLLLSQMRMVADSTFILDQDLANRQDVKIGEAVSLIENIVAAGDEKVVVFSEWERMTRLVAMELEKLGIGFAYFNGSLTAKVRGEVVKEFISDPECRVFISTDAGSTGLNLQVASTLINMDLPWNPAVLEQRVARIFRIGQENPVQVVNFVSKNSFEESLIAKLRFKSTMAQGVLDGGDDTIFVDENRFKTLVAEVAAAFADSEENAVPEEPEELSGAPADTFDSSPQTAVPSEESGSTAGPQAAQPEPAAPAVSDPREVIREGVSFFGQLAKTLSSPEGTRRLVDELVETDPDTGKSSIKIPVSSKESVEAVLTVFQKLLASKF